MSPSDSPEVEGVVANNTHTGKSEGPISALKTSSSVNTMKSEKTVGFVKGEVLQKAVSENILPPIETNKTVNEMKGTKRDLKNSKKKKKKKTISLPPVIQTAEDLRKKGDCAQAVKNKGYTAQELLEGGYTVADVLTCGYSTQALETAGLTLNYRMPHPDPNCNTIGIYQGQLTAFRAGGAGRCNYLNGDVYEGQWKNDMRHGEGRETKANGDVYEGSWKHNEKHGKGIQTIEMRSDISAEVVGTYVGDFKNDEKSGLGTYTSEKG